MEWSEAVATVLRNTLLLLAVVNPVGNIPVFSDMTNGLEVRQRRLAMNLAVLTAVGIVVVFALIGNWSLVNVFSVSVMELRIAGGILLFIVAIHGVMPRDRAQCASEDPRMIAIFPIACPMLVGPGAITMTIIITQSIGQAMMLLTAAVTFSVVLVLVRNSCRLTRLMGPYVGCVIARLLYIMLAAKAVAMVLDGAIEFCDRIHTA